MIPNSLLPMANHVWQSTLFAAAAGLLTLILRRSPARVRHGIWLAASVKFLLPFSLLVALGSHVPWRTAPASTPPNLAMVMDQVSQPFTIPLVTAPLPRTTQPWTAQIPLVLGVVWALGFFGIAGSWWMRWRRVAAAARAGAGVELGLPIPAISSPAFIEPGVFGVFQPVLLLPEGILEHLTQEQWKALVAHELCHVRRRDNLSGLMHMFVQAVFWFHPLTWWIGKRMFEERERACDEDVVKLGNEPHAYARGILKVCELYLEAPAPCMAGVSGSNLRARIEAILNGRIVRNLNGATKALLAVAGLFAVAAPVVIGLLHGVSLRAQTIPADLRFEVASVKPWTPSPQSPMLSSGVPGPRNTDPGRFRARLQMLQLVVMAYDLPLYRLSDPDDRLMIRVEIEAKMPPGTTREQFNVMLQNLLADRMGLKVHWTTKDIDTYVLTVAKGGPKLKPAAPDSPQGAGNDGCGAANCKVGPDGFPVPPPGNGVWYGMAAGAKIGFRGHNETLAEMARSIGTRSLDGPVTDATGLTGRYDYTIFWSAPATTAALGINPGTEPDGPSIFDAIQEQLGLKFEKKKLPAQVLVIDHVEKKPTEN